MKRVGSKNYKASLTRFDMTYHSYGVRGVCLVSLVHFLRKNIRKSKYQYQMSRVPASFRPRTPTTTMHVRSPVSLPGSPRPSSSSGLPMRTSSLSRLLITLNNPELGNKYNDLMKDLTTSKDRLLALQTAHQLVTAERDRHALESQKATARAATLEQQCGQLTSELDSVRASGQTMEAADVQKLLDAAIARTEELDTALADARARTAQMEASRARVAKELAGRTSEAEVAGLRGDLRVSHAKTEELEARLTATERDLRRAIQAGTAGDDATRELRARVSELGAEVEVWEGRLTEAETHAATLDNRLSDALGQLAGAHRDVEAGRDRLGAAVEARVAAEAEAGRRAGEAAQLRETAARETARADAAEKEADRAGTMAARLEKTVADLLAADRDTAESTEETRTSEARLRATNDVLSRKLEASNGQADGLRAALEAADARYGAAVEDFHSVVELTGDEPGLRAALEVLASRE